MIEHQTEKDGLSANDKSSDAPYFGGANSNLNKRTAKMAYKKEHSAFSAS